MYSFIGLLGLSVVVTSNMLVFGVFFITFNVHVIVTITCNSITLPCQYVDCINTTITFFLSQLPK